MRPLLTLLCAMLVAGQIQAEELDIARLFAAAGVEGTLVIATLDGSRTYAHNEPLQNLTPQIGWYVGYLEQPGVTWILAMNMGGKAGLPLRQASNSRRKLI